MRGVLLNTDHDWYTFLKARQPLEEINYWQPSGGTTFHNTAPGTPVFFKLKARHSHAICGFGVFARASVLPAWLAWDSFGERNGAPSFDDMIRRLEKYRHADRRDAAGRYNVGCLMIAAPVFFDEADWVSQPSDWKGQIVSGRGEDLEAGEGARIYRVQRPAAALRHPPPVRQGLRHDHRRAHVPGQPSPARGLRERQVLLPA